MRVDRSELDTRAAAPLTTSPRPFLKWAGSKRLLLTQLVDYIPDKIGAYYEPFLGSGSMFFVLRPDRAVIADTCPEVVETYRAIAADPEAVLAHLREWRPEPKFYYTLRSAEPRDAAEAAARMLYLNKTCWNGLYRVNSLGKFNVPYGRPKSDNLVDVDNLRACSALLSNHKVTIKNADFEESIKGARAGDLVFMDPPYVTKHNNNGFVEYNERIFSWADQLRMAKCARKLANRGVNVLVTNAMHADVTDLYAGFAIKPLQRTSTLAGDQTRRGTVVEAVIHNVGGLAVGAE